MRLLPTKRYWKRLGIGLAILVAIGLIVNGVMAWRMESQLQVRQAAIRAAGDPASIADLAPLPISDEENAAVILARIAPRLKDFSKDHSALCMGPDGESYDAVDTERATPTAQQIETIRKILDNYSDIAQSISAAAECNQYASQADFTLPHQQFIESFIERVQEFRAIGRFVPWRMRVLLDESRRDEAVRCGIELLQLARLYENEPTMVAYLVAIAMRGIAFESLYDALAAGPVSPELHAALDEELARQDNPQRLSQVLKTERAVGADWVYSQLRGTNRVLAHVVGWPMKSYQIGVLDAMGEHVQLADRPWYEVRAKFGPADAPPQPTGHGVLADLLTPAVRAVFQANARSLAVSRALRIDNALRQFAEKNGREATGLEELDLPAEATIDPNSGEPMKLKHTDDGWVIYSVMENGVDDGGNFLELKDYGLAPRKWRSVE